MKAAVVSGTISGKRFCQSTIALLIRGVALRRALWMPIAMTVCRTTDRMTCTYFCTSTFWSILMALPVAHVLDLGMLYHNDKKSGEIISVM